MVLAAATCVVLAIIFALYLKSRSPYTSKREQEQYWNRACASGRLFEESNATSLSGERLAELHKIQRDIVKTEKGFKDPKMKFAYRRLIRVNYRFLRSVKVFKR